MLFSTRLVVCARLVSHGALTRCTVYSRTRHNGEERDRLQLYRFIYFLLLSKPHKDGPLYHPVVGTVSLGSHTVFHYYAYDLETNQTGRDVAHAGSG